MKFTKMSLVAALLVGSSAFAIENVKVSGDAKLYYTTSDNNYVLDTAGTKSASNNLFGKGNAAGEAAVSLNLTADLTKNISAGVKATAITTLGLYNNMVSSTWTGGTVDTYVVNEAWLATTLGKTTVKIGRMPLDTPLVHTETWSLVENTFEAAVVINQDLPDTTLVGAYVGQHNSAAALGGGLDSGATAANQESSFKSFYNGAYAVGIVNNSIKPVTLQGWYYGAQTDVNVQTLLGNAAFAGVKMSHVDAYWLEADGSIEGILAGAQYSYIKTDLKGAGVSSINNDVFAAMLGYEMKDVATLKVAYSSTGKEKIAGLPAGFNLATLADKNGVMRGADSKLYTEAWWNYGYVTGADTDTLHISAEGKAAGLDLGAYYTYANAGKNGGTVAGNDMKEFTATIGKTVGPLDATLAYVYSKIDDQNQKTATEKGSAFSTVQAYLTLNF